MNGEILVDEETPNASYDSKLFKKFLSYVKTYKYLTALAIILLLVVTLLGLAGPYLVKIAIDDYIARKNLAGLGYITLIFASIVILKFLFEWWQQYLVYYIGQKIVYDIRIKLFSHLQNLSLSFHSKNPVGRLVTRVVNDTEVMNEFFAAGIINIFGDIFILIGITSIMLVLNWKLALLSFISVPLIAYSTFVFRKKIVNSYRKVRINLAKVNTHLQENISGMLTVQLFCREFRNFLKFDNVNKAYRDELHKTIFYFSIFGPSMALIHALAIGLIIWYGGGQYVQKVIQLGVLVAFLQYIERFFQPIRDLTEKYNIMQAAMAASERVFSLLDTNEFVPEKKKTTDMQNIRGEVDFQNVWFEYNKDVWVLKDISLHIAEGERIALVGATGAGKTSFISVLNRTYDIQKGHIMIDDIDIKQMSLSQLRRNIGIVLQDVFIFSGTIMENIILGDNSHSEQEIREICKWINADKFISKLPSQYHEVMRERGNNLSVGQKQLLSFARVLIYNPRILVLDEATSSVDPETEVLIRDALEKIMKGRTSIIIAHRLSTIQHADRIVVFHKGEIREIGTHDELLRRKDIYYNLYRLQYKGQDIN